MLDDLIAENKAALFERLDSVKKIKECWIAKELIEIISNSIERDRRLINDFDADEINTALCPERKKHVRVLTKKGVERLVHNGKLFDYQTVCEYFKITPQDKDFDSFVDEFKKCAVSSGKNTGLFKTSRILKLLFKKRKFCKKLGAYTTIDKILEEFPEISDSPNLKKILSTNKDN